MCAHTYVKREFVCTMLRTCEQCVPASHTRGGVCVRAGGHGAHPCTDRSLEL